MSGVLRPWFLRLGAQELFQPIWSDRIGLEWRRNAARIWSISPELLEQEWLAMEQAFDKANVSRWPNPTSVPTLKYSDEKDWHVIQTAWHIKQARPEARVGIVTYNIKDFSRSELRQLGIDLWDPDRLLSSWWDANQTALLGTLTDAIAELVHQGRRPSAPLTDFLKRERLFRFNKLLGPGPSEKRTINA